MLQTGFDLGLHFLATWWVWQQSPIRPERLFYSVITDQALPSLNELKSLRVPVTLEALQQEVLQVWSGIHPGTHRLVLAGGLVQLTLHSGQTDRLLRELTATATSFSSVDSVLLDPLFFAAAESSTNTAPDEKGSHTATPLQRLQVLSRLCRLGSRVWMGQTIKEGQDTAQVHALVPAAQAWSQCGFDLSTPAAVNPEHLNDSSSAGTLATYSPSWISDKEAPTRLGLRLGQGQEQSQRPGQRHLSHQNLPPSARHVVVLGAGLSGSAVAHSLASRGWSVTVLDQGDGVGAGASGLPAGLAAPHVSPDDNVLSRITRAGVRATLQRAQQCLSNGTDWAHSGVLEHRLEGKRSLPEGALWPSSAHEWSTHATTQQLSESGLHPGAQALWHGLAGWVRPRQLVSAQLQTPGIRVLWQQQVQGLERNGEMWTVTNAKGQTLAQAPLVVVASAYESLALLRSLPGLDLPLNPLRGQISFGLMAELSDPQRQQLPPYPVNGHGSFISGVPTPTGQAAWFIGSTFERECTQAPLRAEDHAANQQRLAKLLPSLGDALKPKFNPDTVQGWASLRCTLPDRLPAAGPVDSVRWPGLWISAGMGARGISLAVLCGELIAAWLENEPLPLPPSLARHLAAERFKRS